MEKYPTPGKEEYLGSLSSILYPGEYSGGKPENRVFHLDYLHPNRNFRIFFSY